MFRTWECSEQDKERKTRDGMSNVRMCMGKKKENSGCVLPSNLRNSSEALRHPSGTISVFCTVLRYKGCNSKDQEKPAAGNG